MFTNRHVGPPLERNGVQEREPGEQPRGASVASVGPRAQRAAHIALYALCALQTNTETKNTY